MMPSASAPADPKGGTTLDEKALLLQAWSCVLGEASAVYLSGPITTGPRFVDWVRNTRPPRDSHYPKLLQTFVVEPNTRELQAAAAELRSTLAEPILEPASLHVAHWKQPNYIDLWSVAIEKFIKRLVMMPGWQYSIGYYPKGASEESDQRRQIRVRVRQTNLGVKARDSYVRSTGR